MWKNRPFVDALGRWGGDDDTRPKKHVQVQKFMISGYMLEYVGSYEIPPSLQLRTDQARSPIEMVKRPGGKGKGSTKEGEEKKRSR